MTTLPHLQSEFTANWLELQFTFAMNHHLHQLTKSFNCSTSGMLHVVPHGTRLKSPGAEYFLKNCHTNFPKTP